MHKKSRGELSDEDMEGHVDMNCLVYMGERGGNVVGGECSGWEEEEEREQRWRRGEGREEKGRGGEGRNE